MQGGTDKLKTKEDIDLQIRQISECGGRVWDCTERKQIIITKNSYRPELYGNLQYKPQCLKCGRIGTAKAEKPNGNGLSAVTLEEAKAFETGRRQARKSLYELRSEAFDREMQERKAEWWKAYDAYLKSPIWREKRSIVLKRAGETCEGCRQAKAVQVHHKRYPPGCFPGFPEWIRREKLFDLAAVCERCHEDLHTGRDR